MRDVRGAPKGCCLASLPSGQCPQPAVQSQVSRSILRTFRKVVSLPGPDSMPPTRCVAKPEPDLLVALPKPSEWVGSDGLRFRISLEG